MFAVVIGEPGIGKSRLAAEFAAEVHAGGATVIAGAAQEEQLWAISRSSMRCDPRRATS